MPHVSPPIVHPPPYTYDDPRIRYDEPCFFYDGGFDELCLLQKGIIARKKVGKRTATPTAVVKKRPFMQPDLKITLDLLIKTMLCKVNDEKWKECEKETKKQYKLNHWPIKVTVEKIRHMQKEHYVYSQYVSSSITSPDIKTEKAKVIPIKTIVSSSLLARKRSGIVIKSRLETKRKK